MVHVTGNTVVTPTKTRKYSNGPLTTQLFRDSLIILHKGTNNVKMYSEIMLRKIQTLFSFIHGFKTLLDIEAKAE